MVQVSVDEITYNLSTYLRRVEDGEAIEHGLTIVTVDDVIRAYPVTILTS